MEREPVQQSPEGRGTGEQLGQRGALLPPASAVMNKAVASGWARRPILEKYRVACAQCVKGDPMVEPLHSPKFKDTQRLHSRTSPQQNVTKSGPRASVEVLWTTSAGVLRMIRCGILSQANVIV